MSNNPKDSHIFFVIFIIIILFFGRAYDAGFVTDFTGLHEKMQGKSLLDALDSFGFPSLMPVLNVAYFSLDQFFGLSGYAWFLFFTICYSFSCFYFYKFCKLLLSGFYLSHEVSTISLFVLCFVLCSPFQVEAMIWKVGLGHILSVCFFNVSLYQFLKYLKHQRQSSLLWMVCFHLLSLFTFEWALVFPLFIFSILVFFKQPLGKWKPLIISISSCLIYLILTKMSLGSWIGHYSIEPSNSNIFHFLTLELKYFLKHIFLIHFYPSDFKNSIYGLSEEPIFILFFILVFLGVAGYFKKVKIQNSSMMLLAWVMAGLSLVMILPLSFHQMQWSENDRYGTLFVPFISLFLILILWKIPRGVRYILTSCFIIFNLYFQQLLISYWQCSNQLIEQLTISFENYSNQRVLLLNLPENYKGVFMFRDFKGDNPFRDHLKMRGIDFQEIDLAFQYNFDKIEQSFNTRWIDSTTLQIKFTEWGSWWWRKGIGLINYETEYYAVDKGSNYVNVILKDADYYDVILYSNGYQWISIPSYKSPN